MENNVDPEGAVVGLHTPPNMEHVNADVLAAWEGLGMPCFRLESGGCCKASCRLSSARAC